MTFRTPGPWFDGLLITAAVLAGFYALARIGAPASGTQVAVVFAPWTPPGRAVARAAAAGARIVGIGAVPSVVIAVPEGPGYAASVRRLGAWMVIGPVAAGCEGAMVSS